MSLTDEKCAQVASWAKSFVTPPRIIVDRERAPGDLMKDMHGPTLYVHPEDYWALVRWADRQRPFPCGGELVE